MLPEAVAVAANVHDVTVVDESIDQGRKMPPFVRADYAEMVAVESAGRVENSPPHRYPCRGDYRCETVCAGTRMDLPRSASDCRTAGVAVGMGGTQVRTAFTW